MSSPDRLSFCSKAERGEEEEVKTAEGLVGAAQWVSARFLLMFFILFNKVIY